MPRSYERTATVVRQLRTVSGLDFYDSTILQRACAKAPACAATGVSLIDRFVAEEAIYGCRSFITGYMDTQGASCSVSRASLSAYN